MDVSVSGYCVVLHIYRNLQTIDDISIPTNSQQKFMPVEEQQVSKANTTIDIEPTHKQPCDPQNFLVLIKAGAKSKYQQRREIWRDTTCPSSYKQHGVKYRFMLAMPAHEIIDLNGHNFSKGASSEEIEDMSILQNESKLYKDMIFLSIKDVYEDFYLKTMRILEWAVDRGMADKTSVVILHDDEYCLRPNVLQTICEDTVRSNSSLYAGDKLHRLNPKSRYQYSGYNIEQYFDGHMYALSSDLVRDIVHDPDTRFTSMSLGNSEDMQVGKWVHNQASREDNPLQIKYNLNRSLLWNVGVSCGEHRASSCTECPQGKGALWCKGECEWSNVNGGVCQLQTDNSFDALKYIRKEFKSAFDQPLQPITSPSHKPLIFGAGEGTTATHAFYEATCELGFRSVHWHLSCNHDVGFSNEKPSPGVLAHFDLLRTYKRLKNCTSAPEDYECPTVNQTLHVMLHRINQVISSRDIDAIHDAPYPNFGKYILIATKKIRGKEPIVLLSERNPQDWAKRRVEQHPTDVACRGNDIGTNMYRCLQSAIQAGLGNERINKIFYKFNEPGSDANLTIGKGFELYQNNMRKVSVYHTNLFERNPRIDESQLAKEIGYAADISFQMNLSKMY